MEERRVHVWISGRVQGVFFRYHTQEEAVSRGLSGWVQNLRDGRVEAVFQGEDAAVQGMTRWCYQGPPSARVDHVEVVREDPYPALEGFRIRYG